METSKKSKIEMMMDKIKQHIEWHNDWVDDNKLYYKTILIWDTINWIESSYDPEFCWGLLKLNKHWEITLWTAHSQLIKKIIKLWDNKVIPLQFQSEECIEFIYSLMPR